MDGRHVRVVLAQVERHEHGVTFRLRSLVVAIDEVGTTLNHTLVHQFLERLFLATHAQVEEELVPEARVDEVTRGMLRTTHVEIHVLPVFVGLLRHQSLFVFRVHIAQIVGAAAGKTGHGVQFQREDGLLVYFCHISDAVRRRVPRPFLGMSQWRLSVLGGLILVNLRQLQWQTLLGNHIGHAVLVIHRERFAPVALAREDGIAQTVVHLHAAQVVLRHIFLGSGDGFFHGQSVQHQSAFSPTLHRRVHHDTLFGIETLLAHVGTLDERYDGQVEMLGEGIVARVVRRYCHDGSRTVASQHIFRNPHGDFVARERIDGIRA